MGWRSSVNGVARNMNEARWHIRLRECRTMGVDRSMVLRTLKSIILALVCKQADNEKWKQICSEHSRSLLSSPPNIS